MIPILETYDWEEAFKFCGEPTTTTPLDYTPRTGFTRDDVAVILKHIEGENETAPWMICGLLNDGRYFYLDASCDYTGWDCQAWGSCVVSRDLRVLIKFGIPEAERYALGFHCI